MPVGCEQLELNFAAPAPLIPELLPVQLKPGYASLADESWQVDRVMVRADNPPTFNLHPHPLYVAVDSDEGPAIGLDLDLWSGLPRRGSIISRPGLPDWSALGQVFDDESADFIQYKLTYRTPINERLLQIDEAPVAGAVVQIAAEKMWREAAEQKAVHTIDKIADEIGSTVVSIEHAPGLPLRIYQILGALSVHRTRFDQTDLEELWHDTARLITKSASLAGVVKHFAGYWRLDKSEASQIMLADVETIKRLAG